MSNFFINNNNKTDLLQLHNGDVINTNDKFLKKYDLNNNSIWDSDEINKFMSDLNNMDSNNDGKIDQEESVKWYAQITNTAINKVKELFKTDDTNEVYKSFNDIIRINSEKQALLRIEQDAEDGLALYKSAVGGDVSQFCNNIKELFNTEYAGDKVYRQLAGKQVSSWLLKKAHSEEGLSAKEYIQQKVLLLKALLGFDKFSEQEQESIENSINNLNFRSLDALIIKLTNAKNEDYNNVQKEILADIAISNTNGDFGLPLPNTNANTIGTFLQSEKAEEKLTFNQIYELEMGVPFNQDNSIAEYEQTLENTQIIVMVNNKIAKLKEQLHNFSATPAPYSPSHLQDVIRLLPQIFDSEEAIDTFLEEFGIKQYGFWYDYGIENYPTTGVNTSADVQAEAEAQVKTQMICLKLIAKLENKLQELMDGKTIEDYQNDLKSSYQKAYGARNSVDLASKFKESQQAGVGYVQIGTTIAGVGICLLSNGTMLPVVQGFIVGTGMVVSAAGSPLVSFAEANTQEGGITQEDKDKIIEELKINGILTALGMGEGAIAAEIGTKLLSCSKLLSCIGEYGSMAIMGAMADYAVMGEIDLKQESISNLINIATGIIAHRKMSHIQEHNNVHYENPLQNTYINKKEIQTYLKKIDSNGKLSTEQLDKIADNLYFYKGKDSAYYNELINSGLFELIESGRLEPELLTKFSKTVKITKNYLDDIKLMKNNESYIKHYSDNESIASLANKTNVGDIVEVGNQLYINDNGQMTKINLSKKQCEELFPVGKRFEIRQAKHSAAGNCWFLESVNNIYQNPKTRANMLKMFRADGDDIYVTIDGSKYEYKFSDANLPKDRNNEYLLSNSCKAVNMLEYVAAMARKSKENQLPIDAYKIGEHNGKEIVDFNRFMTDLSDSRLGRLNSTIVLLHDLYEGSAQEAFALLLGKSLTTREYNVSRYGFGSEIEGTIKPEDLQALKDIEKELKQLEGKDNISVDVSFGNHAYNVVEIKNGKVIVQDPYETRVCMELTFKEFLKSVRYFAVTEFD